MRKPVLLGALFGLLIVPVSVLGLVNQTVERLAPPFTFVPRIMVNGVMDTATANGAVTMGALMILSVLFYALIGYATGKLSHAYGKLRECVEWDA